MNQRYVSWPWLLLLGLVTLFLLPAVRATATDHQPVPEQQAQEVSSLVINEVDVDTPGADTAEFVEIYDGGVGNTNLDGLVLVLYNGSTDLSYAAFDLDGYSTNANGYFVIGNAGVNLVSATFPTDTLQQGADAVALFQKDATNFVNGTSITTTNLLDALIYDTSDPDDSGLLSLLNAGQPQINEAGSGDPTVASNQRCPNGSGGQRNTTTYTQGFPSPGLSNTCSGATPTATATPTVAHTPTATATPTSTPPTGVGVTAPAGTTGIVGGQVLLPLRIVNNSGGTPLLGYEFQLNYDPAVLQSLGVSTTNTVSADWQVTTNDETQGQIRVAAYGATPLSGDGVLLNLRFQVTETVGVTSPLTFAYFRWNEGQPTATTQAGDFRTRMLGIGGAVLYGVSGEPVPNVVLNLTGAQSANATTNAQGIYSFSLGTSEAISVTLSKSGDRGAAISALDAAWILQCTVNLRPAAACPLAASDSSGDGQVSAYDAALLARHLVGFTTPPSATGQWHFTPPSRTYPTLTTDLLQEDYTAYLVGDVTGNWFSNGQTGQVAAATRQESVSTALRTDGQQVWLTLQFAPSATPLFGYQLTVHYNPAVLQFMATEPSGTLSAGWQVVTNAAAVGAVQVAAYGVQPLQGDAPLLYLRFHATDVFDENTDLRLATMQVNEGQPLMIKAAPVLSTKIFIPLVIR